MIRDPGLGTKIGAWIDVIMVLAPGSVINYAGRRHRVERALAMMRDWLETRRGAG